MKLRYFIILLALIFSACLAPDSELPVFSQEIARVDDYIIKEDILRFRLRLEVAKYPKEYFQSQNENAMSNPEFKDIVDRVMDKILIDYTIMAFGKRHKIEIPQKELEERLSEKQKEWNPKAFESFLSEQNIPLSRWKQLVEDETRVKYVMEKELLNNVKVSLDEVDEYYKKNSSMFDVSERVRVRQIVTDSLEKANDIHQRLMNGDNFAKLAVDHSVSPDRAKGGDLGYFARGSFPKEFDETCFKLDKGEISAVVKSDYGYHIFKLLDKKPAGRKELTEVAAQIEQILFENKLKKQYDVWLAKAQSEVKIIFKPEVLSGLVL